MSKREIVYYGKKILREQCDLIEEINEEIQNLATDMIETMDVARGVGLAAPQIGIKKKIFVCRFLEGENRELSEEAKVYINPKISSPSKETLLDSEGCLSIPGLRGDVRRPARITITAQNLQGEIFQEVVEGYNARILMHENDHLNGVLFIDRVSLRERKKIDPFLKDLEKKNR